MQNRIAICIIAISASMLFATGCGSSSRDSSGASADNTFVPFTVT